MLCRECGKRSCRCRLAPRDKLHLEVPSWDAVDIVVAPSLKEKLCDNRGSVIPEVSEALDQFFSGGATDPLRRCFRERAECVVGRNASRPVTKVMIFHDAPSALQYAAAGTGEWCAALPLAPPASRASGIYRGLSASEGVSPISLDQPYAVVSHCWPRRASPWVHASVLGIWWKISASALRKAESALALADLFALPIWVDFLCIDQDDNRGEKDSLIAEMGAIFSKSARGFIDCTATPDIRTIDLAKLGKFLEIHKTSKGSPSEKTRLDIFRDVATSRWFSRCWTFQEELLTPRLELYDPQQDAVVCAYSELRARCVQEFHIMHRSGAYEIAKKKGWFQRAASFVNNTELLEGKASWNLGNVMTIRGNRATTERRDRVNSAVGILDIKCGYEKISGIGKAELLTKRSFMAFLEECSKNGDTSWVVAEDPTRHVRRLSGRHPPALRFRRKPIWRP